ncbi:MAG: hypothetical protein KGJ89_03670 [Patescibacteria group bacterium]|nr:hypothetical protein [Patescibacteria group bacterium]MDE2015222.1 hypothetical protein [Patescibacteria group bacterium]MDE2227028.1 hypothetical protein [Patescibacteria group bacterium]
MDSSKKFSEDDIVRFLDGLILNGVKLTPSIVGKRCFSIWKLFAKYETYRFYPLDYRQFHFFIYRLFGMSVPTDNDDERLMVWPTLKDLRNRYWALALANHPDRCLGNKMAERLSHAKTEFIKQSYELILNRRRYLNFHLYLPLPSRISNFRKLSKNLPEITRADNSALSL